MQGSLFSMFMSQRSAFILVANFAKDYLQTMIKMM